VIVPTGRVAAVVFVAGFVGFLAGVVATSLAAAIGAEPVAPLSLQVFNRSAEPADVVRLPERGRREAAARVAPGAWVMVPADREAAFAVVGVESGAEETVTARLPVQAFVFRPGAESAADTAEEGAADGAANGAGRVIPPPASLKVDPFHAKFTSAGGFPIVGSARVSDFALLEAARLVDAMLASRDDVRRALIDSGTRLCILAHDEFTTDLPEFAFLAADTPPGFAGLSGRDFWDARARGTGGSDTDPYCSCGEENLLGYEGDPYAAECILIHEFAHAIHLRGMANVDPTFDDRLRAAHSAALADGLWRGTYASVNHHEYFAEGVQSWFDDNRVDDHDHNHVHLRSQLVDYDPRLAGLCREVFGDTEIRYTKPATRLTGHLAGYDPAAAPRFVWPERLAEARRRIRDHALERARAATPPNPPPETDDAPSRP